MSNTSADALPRSLKAGNVNRLCTVTAHFTSTSRNQKLVRFKMEKARLLSKSKGHYIIDVNLKVIIESTGIRFELVSTKGQVFGQSEVGSNFRWEYSDPKPMEERPTMVMYPV